MECTPTCVSMETRDADQYTSSNCSQNSLGDATTSRQPSAGSLTNRPKSSETTTTTVDVTSRTRHCQHIQNKDRSASLKYQVSNGSRSERRRPDKHETVMFRSRIERNYLNSFQFACMFVSSIIKASYF